MKLLPEAVVISAVRLHCEIHSTAKKSELPWATLTFNLVHKLITFNRKYKYILPKQKVEVYTRYRVLPLSEQQQNTGNVLNR